MVISTGIIFFITRNIFTKLDDLMAFVKPLKKSIPVPNRLLIIRWDRIGDAVVTLPLVQAIKELHPNVQIDVLCSTYNACVFEGNSNINNVIMCDGIGFSYGIKRLFRFLFAPFNLKKRAIIKQALNNQPYDLCIDCMAGEYTWLFKSYAKTMIGARTEDGFSWFYDAYPELALRYAHKPVAQYFMDLYTSLTNSSGVNIDYAPNVPLDRSFDNLSEWSIVEGRFILLNISGTESYRSFKARDLLFFIQRLSETYQVVLFDAPEQTMMDQITDKVPEGVICLPTLSLPQLAVISSKALLFVGIEGGASHYCSSQVNSLIIFSSKSYDYHFHAFASNIGVFVKYEFINSALWLNNRGSGILIQKPKRKYLFKPYYISKEPLSLAPEIILKAVDRCIQMK